jgi:hypothetical protein
MHGLCFLATENMPINKGWILWHMTQEGAAQLGAATIIGVTTTGYNWVWVTTGCGYNWVWVTTGCGYNL